MAIRGETVKVQTEVEINGCLNCPFCVKKVNEYMSIIGHIPEEAWVCEKGVFGTLEHGIGFNDDPRTYYEGLANRPVYPPYIGCPYFEVDKLDSLLAELDLGIENKSKFILLMKKYGITMDGYNTEEDKPLPEEPEEGTETEDTGSTETGETEETNPSEGEESTESGSSIEENNPTEENPPISEESKDASSESSPENITEGEISIDETK